MKKLHVCMVVAVLALTASLCAQQITRVAVVDTARIYNTFFRDSVAVRNYDAKKAEFQLEIDRMTEELKTLQAQKIAKEKEGDAVESMRIEADIMRKTSFLTEYTQLKNVELESLKKKLNSDDAFYASLFDTIKRLAEAEGYSIVFSLQQNNGILWYSTTIDITDKVIANLKPLK